MAITPVIILVLTLNLARMVRVTIEWNDEVIDPITPSGLYFITRSVKYRPWYISGSINAMGMKLGQFDNNIKKIWFISKKYSGLNFIRQK